MANDPHNNASLTLSEDSTTGEIKNNKSTNGVPSVMDRLKPSIYTGIITSSNAGTAVAVASGATSISLVNLDTVITEYSLIAFGTSAVNAIANLAISTNVSTAGKIIPTASITGNQGKEINVGIPANALGAVNGYFAIGHSVAGANHDIMVNQEV